MDKQTDKQFEHDYRYAREAMQWYGWGSPIGLCLGTALLLTSVGLFLWLLHLATIIE